jgi:hypothetical protein
MLACVIFQECLCCRFLKYQLTAEKKIKVLKSLLLFVLAGICEIGGGYLVWLWLREGKSIG